MPLHTCAPPRDAEHKTMSLWVCPECGSTWEGVPWSGVFDFDRNEAVTKRLPQATLTTENELSGRLAELEREAEARAREKKEAAAAAKKAARAANAAAKAAAAGKPLKAAPAAKGKAPAAPKKKPAAKKPAPAKKSQPKKKK